MAQRTPAQIAATERMMAANAAKKAKAEDAAAAEAAPAESSEPVVVAEAPVDPVEAPVADAEAADDAPATDEPSEPAAFPDDVSDVADDDLPEVDVIDEPIDVPVLDAPTYTVPTPNYVPEGMEKPANTRPYANGIYQNFVPSEEV